MVGVLGEDDGDAQTVGAESGTKGLSWRALAFLGFYPFAPKDGVIGKDWSSGSDGRGQRKCESRKAAGEGCLVR